MTAVRATRDLYLWCMSVIYLMAFASLYVQIPGLYGKDGILPAHLVTGKDAESFSDLADGQPSLLRLTPYLGLTAEWGMDCLCLLGVLVSFLMIVVKAQRNCINFAVLWALYLSLFQVGQTFLWFQWDILLLEAGFLTIIVAPLTFLSRPLPYNQHDSITLWLVKWLLFRLMFASGVVKLTSKCPTWWGLTALDWHYESQCIPTSLAWYFHQLPHWFQKLSVVAVYVIEIALPFLFFAPVRSMRLLAGFAQVKLMLLIVLTGNYNFFNWLTVALCVVLLDDRFLSRWMGGSQSSEETRLPRFIRTAGRLVNWLLNLLVYGSLIYWIVSLFSLSIKGFTIQSKIAFSYQDLDRFLEISVPLSIWMGSISLAIEIVKAIVRSIRDEKTTLRKVFSVAGCILFGGLAGVMFAISLVPHTVLDGKAERALWPIVRQWHRHVQKYEMTHSYGLFRSMTGVGGRPEVIIEGSDYMDSGWKEYDFLYKPGNVSWSLPLVAPHQPRLDWQMWFAALGSYQHNPWFLNLVYRILQGKNEVIELLGHNPFPGSPPKYVKATLYTYHYTRLDPKHKWHSKSDWWVREKKGEYLPILTVDEPSFVNYLKQSGFIQSIPPKEARPSVLLKMLKYVRSLIGQMEGFRFILSLLSAGLTISFLGLGSRRKKFSS